VTSSQLRSARLAKNLRLLAGLLETDLRLPEEEPRSTADLVSELDALVAAIVREWNRPANNSLPTDAQIAALCEVLTLDEGTGVARQIVAAYAKGDFEPLEAFLKRRHERFVATSHQPQRGASGGV
jgi:hypothetical protein